jgi:predicted nuclease with RNAse H fold
MVWFGADPGGANAFGVALLRPDGTFESATLSSADEAIGWLTTRSVTIDAAGIDAPLWWSSGSGGVRQADQYLRGRLHEVGAKDVGGTVQSANSLRGAVLIQSVMLATALRRRSTEIPITEAHPKALLKAFWPEASKGASLWDEIARRFDLKGEPLDSEHERDALLAAVAAREGRSGKWKRDLAACKRLDGEQDPASLPWGPVSYWWPND